MAQFADRRFLILLITLIVASPAAAEPLSLSVRSPDGALAVFFELKSNHAPYLAGVRAYYRVAYKEKTLLKDSPLGLDFLGAPPLESGLVLMGSNREAHDSVWTDEFGTEREVRE